MPDTPKHSVSVAGIVVRDDGRVLAIQRRDNGRWEPPGGVLELDETFEEGVTREILEETGVAVSVGTLSGVYKNMNGGIVALVFRCQPLSSSSPQSQEALCIEWLTQDQVMDRMLPAFAVRVRDALDARSIAIRVHDGTNVVDEGTRA